MDETPAVEERGDFLPRYHGMSMHDVTFGYGNSGEAPIPEAMRMPPSRPPSQSSATSRSTYHNTASSASKARSGRRESTLLKLLMRYWDPRSGSVALSEVPLPQIDAHHRRRVQTMIGPETYLFETALSVKTCLWPATGAMRIGLVMLARSGRFPQNFPAERSLPPRRSSRFVECR